MAAVVTAGAAAGAGASDSSPGGETEETAAALEDARLSPILREEGLGAAARPPARRCTRTFREEDDGLAAACVPVLVTLSGLVVEEASLSSSMERRGRFRFVDKLREGEGSV